MKNLRSNSVAMKRITILSIITVVAAFASSCGKDIPQRDDSLKDMCFSVGVLPSRSSFDGVDIVWTSGDRIGLYDNTLTNRRFVTESSGVRTIFKGRCKESDIYYAVYPYDEQSQMTQPGKTIICIPESQCLVSGSFDQGANVSAGKCQALGPDKEMIMKNAGGYIKIVVPETEFDILSLKVSSLSDSPLAGRFIADITGDFPVLEASFELSSSINLTGNVTPGVYYIVAAPQKETGLRVDVVRNDMCSTSLEYESAIVSRNSASGSTLELNFSDIQWEEPEKDVVTVRFLDEGGKIVQEFTTDIPLGVSGFDTTLKDLTYTHVSSGLDFRFRTSHFAVNSTKGLRMGSKNGFIPRPGFDGKSLVTVTAYLNTTGYSAGIYADSDELKLVTGGDVKTISEAGLYEWNISTTENQAVRLVRGAEDGNTFRIHYFELEYITLPQ